VREATDVTSPVGNNIDHDLLVDVPIDNSMGLEEYLAVLLNAEGGEFPGSQSALRVFL